MMSKSSRLFLSAFCSSVLLHSILLFYSAQRIIGKREKIQDSTKIGLKLVPLGNPLVKDKEGVFMNAPQKSAKKTLPPKKSLNTPTSAPSKAQGITEKRPTKALDKPKKKISFDFSPPQNRAEMNRFNSSFSLELPSGTPEDQVEEIKASLFSFYRRVGELFYTNLASEYAETQSVSPNWQIPVDRQKDMIVLNVTYDSKGNIMRIKTLFPAKIKTHSDFFFEGIGRIEKIPNPPKVLLDENGQFSINYALKLNL
jgi:hypothetical protein